LLRRSTQSWQATRYFQNRTSSKRRRLSPNNRAAVPTQAEEDARADRRAVLSLHTTPQLRCPPHTLPPAADPTTPPPPPASPLPERSMVLGDATTASPTCPAFPAPRTKVRPRSKPS
jgi:hypothetical protein